MSDRSLGAGGLAGGEEQAQPFERAARPPVPAIGHGKPRSLEVPDEHIDRERRSVRERENGFSRRAVLADLQEWAADLVKLATDFADQLEPLRAQQDRPLRALAIQLEQAYPALAAVRRAVDDLVEGELGYGFAASPDDRAVSRVDDAFHARKRLRKGVIAIEAELVGVAVGPPCGPPDK